MVFHGISIISAPHNMGVDILFVQLSSLLTEIRPTNEFLHTKCTWDNLETLIRFIFPGGAGYPYLPTQLYQQRFEIKLWKI